MERQEESNQNNQPNVTATIENLQASVAKLQTLLTSPQAQADLQPKLESLRDQALARLQAKFTSGQITTFSYPPQNLGLPLTNPNTIFMEPVSRQIMTDVFNNQHAFAMQQEAIKSLQESWNNPHRTEMEALALQTVVDISNNPYWDSALKEVANFLGDARQNPYLASMQNDLASFSGQATSEATYKEKKNNTKQSDVYHNLLQVESQLEQDSAVNEVSLFEMEEKYHLKNGNKRRLEDVITGEATKIRKDRLKRRDQNGISFNDSVSPVRKGLIPKYQCLTSEEELILARANNSNPENKLKENLVGSVFSLPPILEMANHALQGANNNIVDMLEKKKKRIEVHNYQIDCLRAKGRQLERLADHKKYNDHWNKVQAGHNQTMDELQEIGELNEKVDQGMAEIRKSEIRGRAKRLKQKLERAMSQGGNPNLFSPPAPGSEAKFEDTRSLDNCQQWANLGIGTSVEISGGILYGRVGQMVAQGVKYLEDKTKQQVSKELESSWDINSAVALDRSSDIQDRFCYHETAEQTVRWLTEEINKMSALEAAGGANSRSQTTSKIRPSNYLPSEWTENKDGKP